MINVLEYLEKNEKEIPDKIAFRDIDEEISFKELYIKARQIGSYIATVVEPRKPVIVFMDKSVKTVCCFMGVIYAGCFYTLIDPTFPDDRLEKMFELLDAKLLIGTSDSLERLNKVKNNIKTKIDIKELVNIKCDKLCCTNKINNTDDINDTNKINDANEINDANDKNHSLDIGNLSENIAINEDRIREIRENMTDADPLYCNFTSGSTGIPKGVLVSHRSTIDFIDVFTKTFGITGEDVIGNQAPFDFDVSVKDIYSGLKTGATVVLIPKSYFMFPNKVMDWLEENRVSTLIWAVSALTLINRLHGLKYKAPESINKILFSGEMMPIKQLIAWKSYYPKAMFVNLYGPTEITCNCTYHIVENDIDMDYKLPLGKPFSNEKVFLLDENDKVVDSSMPGLPAEICVAGTALALGYYNSPEATAKAFTYNPANKLWLEPIYRTGDLAQWGEDGKLYFAGRKDFQIKHMGHRIELEEIEAVLNNTAAVEAGCCFFDDAKKKVVAYYVGSEDKKLIIDEMKKMVPEYMVPNLFIRIDSMPINKNGKTDRKQIRAIYDKR